MSDEALNAHLDWLDDCAKEQAGDGLVFYKREATMIECTNPEGHLFNKWAIEGGAVCSICGAKLSLCEILAMLCEHPALKRENVDLRLMLYGSTGWDEAEINERLELLIAEKQSNE